MRSQSIYSSTLKFCCMMIMILTMLDKNAEIVQLYMLCKTFYKLSHIIDILLLPTMDKRKATRTYSLTFSSSK